MAIKQLLELIGDDIVIAKLDKVGKKGEEVLNSLNKTAPDFKLNVDSKPIEETTGHVVKLTEVLHTLRPILQAAGVQFSEFGALTRLAGTSLVALAAATAGAVVVTLAKLEENAARTKGVLSDLFGSSAKGEQAFGALEKQAKQFGTTVEDLAPGLESFQAALNNVDRTAQGFRALKEEDLPGAQLAKDALASTEAFGNFFKLLRAGRLDVDQAKKSADTFFDALKQGETVTSAMLKNLPAGTINLLKEAFGQAGLTTKQFFALVDAGAISVDVLEKALINFGPQAQKAFETKAPKSFSEELSKTFSVLKEGFGSLTGTELSDFLNNQIKLFREGLQGFLADLKAIKDFVRSGLVGVLGEPAAKKTTQGFDEAGFITLGDAVQKLPPKFIDASNSLQNLGAAGLLAGNKVAQGIEQASASIQHLRDAAKATGKEMEDIVIGSTRFKGRLDQIPVFEPQLAGESKTGDAVAKAIQKAFIENPFFKEGVKIPVTPEVKPDELQNSLFQVKRTIDEQGKLTIDVKPTLDQKELVDKFAQASQQATISFQEGIDLVGVFGKFQELYNRIVQLFATPISVQFQTNPFLSGQPTNLASGGMVRGAGSTTSDSILAFLSDKEFVVNARAVSHYGSEFFAALNAMRLPRDFMSRFAMGGLARSLGGNRLAAGGQVRSGNPVVLKIDRQSFNMTAGDDTITQLKRFAVTAQLSSTGRKPRWVR